jgi:hypothetical protein
MGKRTRGDLSLLDAQLIKAGDAGTRPSERLQALREALRLHVLIGDGLRSLLRDAREAEPQGQGSAPVSVPSEVVRRSSEPSRRTNHG